MSRRIFRDSPLTSLSPAILFATRDGETASERRLSPKWQDGILRMQTR